MRSKGLRLLSRRAWRASLTPAMTGLVAGSLSLVLLGAGVYVAAIPPFLWQDAAQGEAIPGHGRADGSSVLTGNGNALLSGADLENAMQPSSAALGEGINLPSLRLPTAGSDDAPEDSGATTQPGEGEGSTTPPTEPEPVVPSGPSAEQEARYQAALVAKYNDLTPIVNDVVAAYNEFFDKALVVGPSERVDLLNKCSALYDRIAIATREVREIGVPQDSVWRGKFVAIQGLYNNMGSASALIRQAWFKSCQCTDPTTDPDDQAYFMEPLISNSTNGKLNAFIEFEQNYAGARP